MAETRSDDSREPSLFPRLLAATSILRRSPKEMNATKAAAVLVILLGGPSLSFFLIDFMRGASLYIEPFLIGAYLLVSATVSAVFARRLFFATDAKEVRFKRLLGWTLLSALLVLLFSGGAQVAAESIAAWNWEKRELPLGDHGSYREFYPGDSGMAHWPTPWYVIPIYGFITGVIWCPLVLAFLSIVHWLERMVHRVLDRHLPNAAT